MSCCVVWRIFIQGHYLLPSLFARLLHQPRVRRSFVGEQADVHRPVQLRHVHRVDRVVHAPQMRGRQQAGQKDGAAKVHCQHGQELVQQPLRRFRVVVVAPPDVQQSEPGAHPLGLRK